MCWWWWRSSARVGLVPSAPSGVGKGAPSASCGAPDPALQALAGAYPLRSCILCPRVGAPRASLPASKALEVSPVNKVVFKNDALEPVRMSHVDEEGTEVHHYFVAPGARAAFLTTAGTWWRGYTAAGDLLLEHQVGLVPIVDTGLTGTPGACYAPRAEKASYWTRDHGPFPPTYLAVPENALTVGFINLAQSPVDLAWLNHSATHSPATMAQLAPRQPFYMATYDGHKWLFRDETGRALDNFAVEDVAISDCARTRRSAVAAGLSVQQPLAAARGNPEGTGEPRLPETWNSPSSLASLSLGAFSR